MASLRPRQSNVPQQRCAPFTRPTDRIRRERGERNISIRISLITWGIIVEELLLHNHLWTLLRHLSRSLSPVSLMITKKTKFQSACQRRITGILFAINLVGVHKCASLRQIDCPWLLPISQSECLHTHTHTLLVLHTRVCICYRQSRVSDCIWQQMMW